ELDAQRRAVQLESLAETGFEISAVRIGNGIQRTAVHDDARRVLASLVSITHLGPINALARRRLLLYRCVQLARQTRGGKLGKGGRMGGVDRTQQGIDP